MEQRPVCQCDPAHSFALLVLGVALQAVAVVYGLVLARRRRGAFGAWLCLLGAMTSMLVWRVVVLLRVQPPAFFNPLIAIWGSTCMLAAMFLFGREVARRESVERERDALLQSERIARGDAERANRLKDDFLGTLSHELRTPLAAILGWCALLRSGQAKAEQAAHALETIERNARAQSRLVDDLLDVTRMQAGALPAISLTAHAREEDRAHALASGFQEHLAKPIDLPRLAAAIQRLAAPPGDELGSASQVGPATLEQAR